MTNSYILATVIFCLGTLQKQNKIFLKTVLSKFRKFRNQSTYLIWITLRRSLGWIKSNVWLHSNSFICWRNFFLSKNEIMQLAGIQNIAVITTTVTVGMTINFYESQKENIFNSVNNLLTILSRRKRKTLLMLISSMISQKRSTTSWMVFSHSPWNRFFN